MIRLRLRTPSRLHFGLLSWGTGSPRQFGGGGLMIDLPGLELIAEPAPDWQAEGPMAARVLGIARNIANRLTVIGYAAEPARLVVRQAPPEHVGLGVGTQLGLGVARLLAGLAGCP